MRTIKSLLPVLLLVFAAACAPRVVATFERPDTPPTEAFVIQVTVNQEAVHGVRLTIIDGTSTAENCIIVPEGDGLADSSCSFGTLEPGTYLVAGSGPVGEVGCFVRYFEQPTLAAGSLRPVVCEIL